MVWGIIRLRLFNEALLGKWLWHYGLERDALWGRVIEVKYGSVLWGGGWVGVCTSPVLGPYRVSLWRTIRHGWPSLSCHVQYEVGDGTRVKFWQDGRSGESSLAVCYLSYLESAVTRRQVWQILCSSSTGFFTGIYTSCRPYKTRNWSP